MFLKILFSIYLLLVSKCLGSNDTTVTFGRVCSATEICDNFDDANTLALNSCIFYNDVCDSIPNYMVISRVGKIYYTDLYNDPNCRFKVGSISTECGKCNLSPTSNIFIDCPDFISEEILETYNISSGILINYHLIILITILIIGFL